MLERGSRAGGVILSEEIDGFTIDAGPQVKVICPMAQRAVAADALGRVIGVQRVILSQPGGGAELLET